MASMSKDFTRLLNTLIDQQVKAAGRQTEWFNMSADERAAYIAQVGERLLEMQQSTLSVLAAQHYQMQDNPVSVGDQLQTLQQRRKQMNAIPDTPATSAYKLQLDRDIQLYSRQQTAITHYDSTWNKALGMLSPGGAKQLDIKGLKADALAKQDKLNGRIKRLEQQLTIQVADSTFSQAYVRLFSELQAYKDVSARYNTLLKATPEQQAASLGALAKAPRASDDLPVNISLLMMEERPGYIRMNVALVNASTDGRFKDFFLENGRLVVPTDGVLNFSFGTAARSLAWQQQYRLKNEPPSFRSPTYAPIRSVLVKTSFVEQYFANHLVSESSLREGFKAQVLGNGHKLLLTSVDRKVPNQVGIQVSGQSPSTTVTREVPLAGALSELINQNADIASFQTIGLEGFRQNSYHPDRDGVFVNIHELEGSVGLAERQYLLEMPQGGEYRAATPFALMTVDGDKVSSSHLSKAQTDALYQYNAAFFDKLEQLRDGGIKASRLFEGSRERAAFTQQLTRLLERNHITPAGVLMPEHSRASLRDIKGNNLNKVLWEQAFAAAVWQTRDNDALLRQAAKDLQLKTGLASLGAGFEPRQGSADIRQFAADPVQFAKTHTLSAEALVKSGRLPAQGNVQLVKVAPNLYELEYTEHSANDIAGSGVDSVPAYFLGYNGPNQANAAPAYVDIPKHAAAGSFLFTGTLSGCSLVVTSLDANTFRVYHDGRVNSSLLYDNVVMAVDYKDYQVAGTAEGLAAAYMQYVDGQWQLVFQRQEYQREGQMVWPKLRDGAQPLQIQNADPQVVERNRAEFAAYREQVHQNLKKVATQFGVSVDGVADGVYRDGAFSPEHPAIAAWNQLREAVQAKVNADIQQLADKRYQLQQDRRGASDKGLIDQQIKQLNLTQDYYRAQYDPVLREAGSVEKTWLWQQIKAKDGSAAVVRTDDTAIQGAGEERASSVGERYAIAEAYQRGARGTAFSDGLRDFREIRIPGVDDRMSALKMKQLFLDGTLTPRERGALSGRITETAQAEYIDKVLRQTAVFSEDFHKAGSVFDRLAPQDFYLSLVGDRSGGRCYPLVRAMAVALASGGEAGVNSLVQKLFLASADPQAGSSTLLKNSLIRLHSNVEAVQASRELGQFKLAEVVSRLAAGSGTSMFALNTQNHSMMVGSTQTAEGRRYYFYDPNVGIFAFDSTKGLSKAMQQHLVTRNLAAHYGSLGTKSLPTFNLIEIDTGKMAEVPVGNGLNVADLSRPEELAGVIGQRRQVEQAVDARQRVSEDLRLGAALTTFDAEQWGARFEVASTRLAREHQLGSQWIPIIANIEAQQEGGYRVQFINRDQPELQPRWLDTRDGTFVEFRRFVDEHMRVFNEHFTLEHGQIRPRAGVSEASPVDGLNAGFAVQTLIQWFARKSRSDEAQGTVSPDLATALKIHSYLGLAQIGHGTLQDVAKVTELVQTALRGEAMAAETSLKDFASTLGHTVNEGAGVLFGGAMVGLDAYELAHAENDVQKAVFGTQLAFDSASFVTGAAGVGAGLLGASTAAAVLGGAGVILGGLAVGFTALAQAFGAVAEDAKAVGRYFDTVDKAYKGNGYRYDAEKKVLVPLAGAVVKRLDLRNNQIGFDSQYIYRTHHGSTGSGAINYFFWAGDFPRMIHDRGQAIEVRSGIGYKDATRTLEHGDSTAVILPGTPKSYISYEYMILPGSTTRHDTGFDVIRRLEEDRRFDYDFYIFPSEETIRRIRQEYVDTPIEVLLDSRDRQLVIPELPKELYGYLNYQIKGAGGRYLVGLNEGTRVDLASESGTPSRWIIDSSQLASESISVSKDQLVVGGVVVKLDPAHNGQVLVVNAKGEVREVDFAGMSARVVEEDASKWQLPGQRIEQHLSELAKAHQLHGQYVVVDNYSHEGRNVGRAFYDVAKDRMLFTDTQVEQARNAQLGAVIGEHAYFVDAENAAAWRVEIATGKVDAQFAPSFNQSAGRISRFWQEGDAVYLARRYQLKEREAELNFRIIGDRMELVGVVGDDALLQLSARTDQHGDALKALLQGYQSQATPRATPVYSLGAPMMEPSAAALVTVFGLDNAKVAHRYWVRTSDGTVIKPNLAPPAGQQPPLDAQGKPQSAWPIPADLVFAGSMPQPAGQEVFFFYSQKQKVLFRQEGPGQKVLDGSQPSALRLATPTLANVLELNGHLVAVTEDGLVARIEATGRLSYEAVNEHWLKGRSTWWQDLASVNGSSATLAVFGAKAADGKSALPVWYHNGQVIVAASSLQGKPLQFLGFDSASSSARLFEPESGKLYLQAPLTSEALAAAFGGDEVLEASAQLPAATLPMPEVQLRSAVQVDAGLRLTTVQGEILLRANNGDVQLVALDKGWQQQHLGNLSQALAQVAGQWRAKGVLTLQGAESQGWFDVASGRMFASTGIPAASDLRFVGVAAESQRSAYVYSPTDQALYKVKEGAAQKLGHYANVERIGSSLLLQGGGGRQDDLAPPLIAGVDSVVLHGGGANDTYRFSPAMWAHYRTVVIDNDDPGQALDRLILPVADGKNILVSRRGEDVLLTDAGTGTALVLRQVLGSEAAAHRHLQIELQGDSSVISVDHLVKGFAQAGSAKDGLFELSSRERQAVPMANDIASVTEAEGPSLAKLSGAMAAFADTGGAREHLPQNRQAAQAVLVPSLT